MALRIVASLLIALSVTAWPVGALADDVLAGLDYFHTLSPTWFDFGPQIGVVNFRGLSIGPGNTDTIVRRRQDALLPTQASSATIPIEMQALSLASTEPVFLPTFNAFFDVFVTLDPVTPSTGSMTIRHEIAFPNNFLNTPEGTFDSLLTVNADARFRQVRGPIEFIRDIDGLPLSSQDTAWTHTHDRVPPFPGATIFHLAEVPGFPLGRVEERFPPFGALIAIHTAENGIPEPATLWLVTLAVLGPNSRRRVSAESAPCGSASTPARSRVRPPYKPERSAVI